MRKPLKFKRGRPSKAFRLKKFGSSVGYKLLVKQKKFNKEFLKRATTSTDSFNNNLINEVTANQDKIVGLWKEAKKIRMAHKSGGYKERQLIALQKKIDSFFGVNKGKMRFEPKTKQIGLAAKIFRDKMIKKARAAIQPTEEEIEEYYGLVLGKEKDRARDLGDKLAIKNEEFSAAYHLIEEVGNKIMPISRRINQQDTFVLVKNMWGIRPYSWKINVIGNVKRSFGPGSRNKNAMNLGKAVANMNITMKPVGINDIEFIESRIMFDSKLHYGGDKKTFVIDKIKDITLSATTALKTYKKSLLKTPMKRDNVKTFVNNASNMVKAFIRAPEFQKKDINIARKCLKDIMKAKRR